MEPEIPDFQEEQIRKSNLRKKKSTPRRTWLKKVVGGLFAALAGGFYLRYEANWLETTTKTVTLKRLRKGAKIRILHLSDLHRSGTVSIEDLDSALEEGIRRSPDLMLITGDFITGKLQDEQFRELGDCLARHASKVPSFACLGNHDGGNWAQGNGGYDSPNRVKAMLGSAKVNLLENRSMPIFVKGCPIVLAGLGDYWNEDCRPQGCLRPVNPKASPPRDPTLLLCHNPDAKGLLDGFQWDLMLSGHTHGGQFRVPFLGYAPFAPVKDRSMVEGLHSWRGRQVHVTRGVGNLFGVRLNCRPEVSILDLVST
ncbi:MAG TPA: hypothetical protein DCG39_01970 [Opitutae bacterium]|nr:hypothetical protein [Opitutae bacterium]